MASGFSFGATTTAAPAFGTGSLTFGTPAPQPTQQFGFGGLSSSTPSLFGTQTAPTTSTLGFNKPATGFGAPAAQTPGFGASFGATPAQQPTTGFGASFGATPAQQPATGFGANFGATPAQPIAGFGSNFGIATSQPSTGFGGTSFTTPASGAATAPGLSFGAPVSSTGAPNLSFGAPATSLAFGTPANTGLSFGQPGATAAPGLSFGAPATAAPTALSFGAPTSTGLNFGAPTSTASPFAVATSAAPTSGLAFGAAPPRDLNFVSRLGVPTTHSFCFAGPAPTTSTGLSFTTPPTTGLSFGLGGVSSASGTLPTSTATPQVGLGGVASSLSKPGGAAAAALKEVPPKEQPLMNEFVQLVEQFKKVVQDEKIRSSEVARSSVKEFHKVESNLDILNNHFNQIENQLLANRAMVEKLKMDTAKGLQNIEIAQRTQETPPGLQYENQAPLKFFADIVDEFEVEMQVLKVKIDNTEKFVRKSSEWNVLTSQDLAGGLRRLHDIFVALAGRMQAIHNQVETQKEIFLSIRRQTVKDNVNPFERSNRNSEALNVILKNALKSPPQLSSGPTPFNNVALGTNLAMQAQLSQPSTFGTPTITTSNNAMGLPFSSSSMFKPPDFSTQPFQLGNSQGFQLQKPPTGNKRGKQ